MIEIPLIFGKNKDGEKWIEYVCSTREEAQQKLAYLRSKQVVVPEIEDEIWDTLGLGFIEREFIIKNLQEFKMLERADRPSFNIEYDYLNDTDQYEELESKELIRFRVIKVSDRNSKGNYIHWLVPVNEINNSKLSQTVYKISLPKPVPIGTEENINLNEAVFKS